MIGSNFTSNSIFEKQYTSVKQYGAVGDGIHDDTAAIQKALNECSSLRFEKDKIYKLSLGREIDESDPLNNYILRCDHNIDIDFNNSSFLVDKGIAFLFSGTETEILRGQPDYDPRLYNYQLIDSEYSGYAYFIGTNKFEEARNYYIAGFSNYFDNGNLCAEYPIKVENPTIYLIDHVTVNLKNLKDMKFTTNVPQNFGIYIYYGWNCTVSNFNTSMENIYDGVAFSRCLSCSLTNSHITLNTITPVSDTASNSYIVVILNSSYTWINECNIYSKYWHAVCTGGNQICYRTKVTNSTLKSLHSNSYEDHENGWGTTIDNCSICSCMTGAMSNVSNCTIHPVLVGETYASTIRFFFSSNKEHAVYSVSNCTVYSGDVNNSGILMHQDHPRTNTSATNDFYMTKLNITNVRVASSSYSYPRIKLIFTVKLGTVPKVHLGECTVLSSDVVCEGINSAQESQFNLSKFVCKVMNQNDNGSDSYLGRSNFVLGEVYLTNCKLYTIQGSITKLHLSNSCVEYYSPSVTGTLSITEGLYGGCTEVTANIVEILKDIPEICVSNLITKSATNTNPTRSNWYNTSKKPSDAVVHYQEYVNGVLTTKSLPST